MILALPGFFLCKTPSDQVVSAKPDQQTERGLQVYKNAIKGLKGLLFDYNASAANFAKISL